MAAGITSAHVIPYDQLSEVRVDPQSFGQITSARDQFALLILETDTGSIRVIQLDQERVTKVAIEASSVSPALLMEIASVFSRHKLSVIYSLHALRSNLRLEVFLRETDVSPLVLDLEKVDSITKVEILELCAS